MINYTEKGIGLHDAVAAAGHWLAQVDGVWVSSDDVAVQAIIDAFDAKGWALPVVQARIKEEARQRIVAVMPEWKQANATARAVELISLGQASGAEWDALQAAWAWVKAVRDHSNSLEAQAAAMDDPLALDITVGWPGV